jgi:hypothetical protein
LSEWGSQRPPDLPSGALALLVQAREYARQLHRDAWQFAVEIGPLAAAGLTNSTLRWLVCQGHVEHAIEVTPPGDGQRRFQPVASLALPEGTCFVLTDKGAALARGLAGLSAVSERPAAGEPVVKPRWDGELRVLWCGGVVVKEFRRPAPNQELVLAAFEEESWPAQIDDPLPGSSELDAKQRLHDTIIRLNRNQKSRRLVFRGDGSGKGVRWSLRAAAFATSDAPDAHQIDSGEAGEG